jgi:hypothetical protein
MDQIPALKRGMRFRDLVLFYVVVVLSVRWTATAATAGPSILTVWVAAIETNTEPTILRVCCDPNCSKVIGREEMSQCVTWR